MTQTLKMDQDTYKCWSVTIPYQIKPISVPFQ
jgi:hypothetical protein